MPSRQTHRGKTRRELMALLGITGAAGLAGCLGDDDDDPEDTPTPTPDPGDPTTPTPPDDPEREVMGTYREAISSDGETTIPHLITDTTSGWYVATVLDGAYSVTSDDQIFPLWCDMHTEDGQVWEVEMRDNLEWSDPYGDFDAEDFVWYIQNIHQADWAGSVDAPDWAGIDTEVTGTYTFEIDLGTPQYAWIYEPVMWGHVVTPKAILEDYVDDQDLEGIQTDERLTDMEYTGNLGPYTLVEWERDSAWRTVRNEDYYMHDLDADDFPDYVDDDDIEAWQGAPYFEGYEFETIPEEATRLSALQTGEVDKTNIPEGRVQEFQEAVDGVYVNLAPQPYLRVLSYNMRLDGWEAWTDTDPEYDGPGEVGYGNEDGQEIRYAISHAIDKELISDDIEQGLSDPAQTFQPSWSEYYIEEGVKEFGVGDTYDHDIARDKLETYLPAGYGYDGGDLIAPEGHDRWDGEQVTLQWVNTAGIETYSLTAEHVQAELAEIGIGMDIESVLWETLLGQWLAGEPVIDEEDIAWGIPGTDNPGHPFETEHFNQWDLLYGINFNTYPRVPDATDVFWTREAPLNYYGYLPEPTLGPNNDWSMAQAYDEGRGREDLESRIEVLGEIMVRLSEDQPNNFVTMGIDHYGYRDRVVGPEEVYDYDWNYQLFHFDQ